MIRGSGGMTDFQEVSMADGPEALDRFDQAILRILQPRGGSARRPGPPGRTVEKPGAGADETAGRGRRDRRLPRHPRPGENGQAHVAFVEVRLSDTREAALQAFNRAVLAVPEVEECHMIASRFDYLLKVRTDLDLSRWRRLEADGAACWPNASAPCQACRPPQTSTYVGDGGGEGGRNTARG
jgi:Lrp/AsnC family leucine-responsive transcriptional regulator